MGKQGHNDRLKSLSYLHLTHHILLRFKIYIYLNGAGPCHHIQTQSAFLRHICPHVTVTLLRHPGYLFTRRKGVKAHRQSIKAHLLTQIAQTLKVLLRLRPGSMNRFVLSPRKLKLSPRLQSNARTLLLQTNHLATFRHRRPIVASPTLQQRSNTGRPLSLQVHTRSTGTNTNTNINTNISISISTGASLVRQAPVGPPLKQKLLVLRPNPPVLRPFLSGPKPRHQILFLHFNISSLKDQSPLLFYTTSFSLKRRLRRRVDFSPLSRTGGPAA